MVANAFSSSNINPILALTLIVPIPKVDRPSSLKDFKPISLCSMVFMIVSKVLVNKIRPYLNSILCPL